MKPYSRLLDFSLSLSLFVVRSTLCVNPYFIQSLCTFVHLYTTVQHPVENIDNKSREKTRRRRIFRLERFLKDTQIFVRCETKVKSHQKSVTSSLVSTYSFTNSLDTHKVGDDGWEKSCLTLVFFSMATAIVERAMEVMTPVLSNSSLSFSLCV